MLTGWEIEVAAFQFSSPAWEAVIVTGPLPRILAVRPVMERILGLLLVNETASFEVAVADKVNVVFNLNLGSAGLVNAIFWF